MAGTWRFGENELTLTQQFQTFSGTLVSGDRRTDVSGRLRGDQISFRLPGVEYSGRVDGDAVELELPKTSSPLDVDVKAERVERLLINLASYGRERMPLGGRLSIDLATVVVDRRFIAKYPNVRQGPHALITVTEGKRTPRADEPLQRHDEPTEPSSDKVATEKPGMALGTLQGLINECSDHLWMTVGPPGEMVVKIHLPLGASDDRSYADTSLVRRNRGSVMARWFRH